MISAIVALLAGAFLFWSLRPIFLPIIIGTFAAYMCIPLLQLFTRMGIPRAAGILLLFGSFILAIVVLANQIGSIIPDERERLILQTRFQYKLNERYKGFMGLDKKDSSGNMVYKYFGSDFNNFMENINAFLRLEKKEQDLFLKYREGYMNKPPIEDQYYEYFLKNTEQVSGEAQSKIAAQKEELKKKTAETKEESPFSVVMAAIKLWIIMPFVFLFLLIDDG
jgi:hypothetical protein